LEIDSQPRKHSSPDFTEARIHPRFALQVDISVYCRRNGKLKGHTVDISESGISAILVLEVEVGNLVQLEFVLPSGPVTIRALVRHKTAFRYGFQFVEPDAHGRIKSTCDQLKAQQHHPTPKSSALIE
jgi:hypothetical protein